MTDLFFYIAGKINKKIALLKIDCYIKYFNKSCRIFFKLLHHTLISRPSVRVACSLFDF